jgi:hypothetical protein
LWVYGEDMPSQVEEVIQRGIGIAAALSIVTGTGAIEGIITNYVINEISDLPPLIAGGITGIRLLVPPIMTCLAMQNFASDSKNSAKNIIREIASDCIILGALFGIGAGLVAFGVTSPATIGASTSLAFFPLMTLLGKVMPNNLVKVENISEHQDNFYQEVE